MALQDATPRVRNRRAEITDNSDHGTVTFKFMDGGDNFVASLGDLPESIIRQLALSRLHNKLMDTYADPSTDPRHEVLSVYSELKSGVWSQRGEAGPKRPTLLIEALCAVYGKSEKSVEAFLEKRSEAEVKSYRNKTTVNEKNQVVPNPVYVKMEEIKARRAMEKAKALRTAAKGLDLAAIDIPDIGE